LRQDLCNDDLGVTGLDLQTIRQQIDAIDEQLLKLFNQRADCAIQVADTKKQALKEGEKS